MTQPLDFSNQDLRNRSFKGQNLAGADFRNADIRGCDFSKANLEGADFSGVTTGQSNKNLFDEVVDTLINAVFIFTVGIVGISFVYAIATAVVDVNTMRGFASIVLMFGIGTFLHEFLRDFLHTGKFVILSTIAVLLVVVIKVLLSSMDGVIGLAAFFVIAFIGAGVSQLLYTSFYESKLAVALTSLVMGVIGFRWTVSAFSKGYVVDAIVISFFAIILLWYANFNLQAEIKKIRNKIGTSFEDAILTNTKFTGAILRNCKFTGAMMHQTEWTYAHFTQCNFSEYLENQLVRELCVSRIGINENFSFANLCDLNLIGVNLSNANLTSANLNRSNLKQADLENSNLSNVQAIQTDFTRTNLTGACLENWAITSETIFNDVICSYIYLDSTKKERKPASGSFEQGDFEKLVHRFTKTLDFLFRNGIDPQAFDFALQYLRTKYPEAKISINAVEDLGDGVKQIKLNKSSDAPTGEMHAQGVKAYEAIHQKLEASRNKVWELQQKLDRIDLENKLERSELETQLAVAKAKLEERPTSQDLQNLFYHQATPRLLYAPHSTFTDTMTDKSIQSGGGDISYVGRDNKGVSGKDQQGVAGRDISGTVTNTIQQLRETNQPEAPQLSDLLEKLQKAVESCSELGEPEKQKALEYLNQIGEMSAKDPSQKKGMLPILLDAFTGVISKAANLIDPVKKIAAAILSIWQA